MGNVTTKEIVHAPFEDADKNLPMEAAALLSPIVNEGYQGDPAKIHPAQVTKLLQHLGIDKDNRHCIYEKKLKRKYATCRASKLWRTSSARSLKEHYMPSVRRSPLRGTAPRIFG